MYDFFKENILGGYDFFIKLSSKGYIQLLLAFYPQGNIGTSLINPESVQGP
jgi:hypothetical protein